MYRLFGGPKGPHIFVWLLGCKFSLNNEIKKPNLAIKLLTSHHYFEILMHQTDDASVIPAPLAHLRSLGGCLVINKIIETLAKGMTLKPCVAVNYTDNLGSLL